MKFKVWKEYQCAAIVQPGEYLIDKWDNKPCIETNPYNLIKCEHCEDYYCLAMHWHKHLDSIEREANG